MDTHVFAAFAATEKLQTHQEVDFRVFAQMEAPRAPQKWICLRFALTVHQKHPQNVFVLCFRPKSHRTR